MHLCSACRPNRYTTNAPDNADDDDDDDATITSLLNDIIWRAIETAQFQSSMRQRAFCDKTAG